MQNYKKRPAETAYDPNCTECLITMYDDYVMKAPRPLLRPELSGRVFLKE